MEDEDYEGCCWVLYIHLMTMMLMGQTNDNNYAIFCCRLLTPHHTICSLFG